MSNITDLDIISTDADEAALALGNEICSDSPWPCPSERKTILKLKWACIQKKSSRACINKKSSVTKSFVGEGLFVKDLQVQMQHILQDTGIYLWSPTMWQSPKTSLPQYKWLFRENLVHNFSPSSIMLSCLLSSPFSVQESPTHPGIHLKIRLPAFWRNDCCMKLC